MKDYKVMFLDIEATGLKADFGTLLCVGYKWADSPRVYCPAITDYASFKKDPTDDSGLAADFYDELCKADMIVTYYGKGYDQKFLTAKFLEHNIGYFPPVPHVDLYFTVKANMALARKSLQNTGYYLGLSTEKTPVEGKIWRKAAAGHSPSVKYIIKHCKKDVLLLEEAYLKLRPLVRTHPRKPLGDRTCKFCGSSSIQRRGEVWTAAYGAKIQVYCNDCHGRENRVMVHA